jgi:hypothetical protein
MPIIAIVSRHLGSAPTNSDLLAVDLLVLVWSPSTGSPSTCSRSTCAIDLLVTDLLVTDLLVVPLELDMLSQYLGFSMSLPRPSISSRCSSRSNLPPVTSVDSGRVRSRGHADRLAAHRSRY